MANKIDMIDKKILYALDSDSRQPSSQISKQARCSRAIAEYRIKKLTERGIIVSLCALADPSKFGFTSWKVYVQFNTRKKEIYNEIIGYIEESKNIWWGIKCEGNFDMMFSIITKTVHEFYEILHDFQMKFSKYELRLEITTHINSKFASRGYLMNSNSHKLCDVLENPSNAKVDKIDIEILKLLVKNSRVPSTEIAKKVKTTPRIVNYRIKDLLRKKVITHFRLIPDINKIGMDYYKVMVQLKDLTKIKEKSLMTFLEMHPNIINYTSSWGPWELEFETEIENYKNLIILINEFRGKFSDIIKKVEFVLIYDEIKATNDFLGYMDY